MGTHTHPGSLPHCGEILTPSALLPPPVSSSPPRPPGDRAAVDAEREKHKAIGERLGCWKAGVLVENDSGDVAKALAEAEQQQQGGA